jgi:crotonobetainyl-CoA:carnitine CoA-transferase CaiB-like acyl-CoA transferase
MDHASTHALPLENLTVVAIEQAVAAPLATRQLADMGARVIKVERPEVGDFARSYDETVQGQSSFFVWLNRGKESITADLKDPADRELIERLLGRADIFLQNLAPGAASRMGLGAEQVVERHPRAIAVDLSGYGAGGPYEHKKAYDLLIQCEAGLLSITGTPQQPAKVGISVADIAGGMYSFSAILAALYARERTGRGAALSISLFDALAEWMGHAAAYGHGSGHDPRRSGAAHASIAPYGPFSARDGRELFVGVQNEREWRLFCDTVLEQPQLAEDPRFATNVARNDNVDALGGAIARLLERLDLEELERRLDAAGIAYGRMRAAGDLFEHPQMTGRDRVREVETPAGPVPALLPPIGFPGAEARMGPVPALGAHDESVRRWLDETEAEATEAEAPGASAR